MASKTEICNRALLRLGQQPIMDSDENSQQARVCNQEFDGALEATLRAYPWPFAVKRANLARLAETPAFGYAYYYQMPSDNLRVVEWQTESLEYQMEGNMVATNAQSVSIRYVSKSVPVELMDTQTAEAVVLNLAMRISITLTENIELKSMLYQEYNMALQVARNTWAVEDYPRDVIEGDWIPAREGTNRLTSAAMVGNPWGANGDGVSNG